MMAADGEVKSCCKQLPPGDNSEPLRDCHTTEAQAAATLGEAQLKSTPLPKSNGDTPKKSPALHQMTKQKLSESVAALKFGLAIDDISCGAPTRKSRPCKNPIPVKNSERIASLLHILAPMTQASEELLPTLKELARLVHCHWHTCGRPSDSRVDAWLEAIPKGEMRSKSSALINHQIRQALDGGTSQCAGITKDRKQCIRHIGGQKVQNCSNTIAQLVLLDGSLEGTLVELFLSTFEANRYCHQHMSQLSMSNVTRWSAQLTDIREKDTETGKGTISSNTSLFVKKRQDAVMRATRNQELLEKIDMMLRRRLQPSAAAVPEELSWSNEDLAAFWSPGRDLTPLDIISNGDEGAYKEYLNPSVCDVATRPLDKIDERSGYVYLYEVDGNPGFVKIGYTLRDIAERHEEWTFQCNRTVKVLYPAEPHQLERVPNACRIEALCHAELDEFRVTVFCHGCLKQHIEWFEINATPVIASIQKWSAWMRSSPYRKTARRGYRLSTKWQALTLDHEKFTKSVLTIAQVD